MTEIAGSAGAEQAAGSPSSPSSSPPSSGQSGELAAGGWRSARPELVIALAASTATAAAAYVVAHSAAAVVVVVVVAAGALAVVSRLLPGNEPTLVARYEGTTGRRVSAGRPLSYWQLEGRVRDGIGSRSAYDANLGPYLQHLLAARLSERYDVNLYREPEAAREVLCPRGRDLDLWPWVDPARQSPVNHDAAAGGRAPGSAPGIPARALSRLISRVEEL